MRLLAERLRLRLLKDRTGLSLTALARRTAASRSAWGRYLNGQALPPWEVAAVLARLAGTNEIQLQTLWELADQTHRRRTAATRADVMPAPQDTAPATPPAAVSVSPAPEASRPAPVVPVMLLPQRPQRSRPLSRLLTTGLPTALAAAALALTLTAGWSNEGHQSGGPAPTRTTTIFPSPSQAPAVSPAPTVTVTKTPRYAARPPSPSFINPKPTRGTKLRRSPVHPPSDPPLAPEEPTPSPSGCCMFY